MRYDPATPHFVNLVTVMNVFGTLSVIGLLGRLLEVQREGAPTLAAIALGAPT